MTENEFKEHYRNMPSEQLLDLVYSSHEYREEAVNAAVFELESRNLTVEQREEADEQRRLRLERENTPLEHFERTKHYIQSPLASLALAIHLDAHADLQTSTLMSRIIIGTACLAAYELYSALKDLWFMTKRLGFQEVGMDWMYYLFPVALLLLSVYLFWRVKRIGWQLLGGYFLFSAIMPVVSLIVKLEMFPWVEHPLYLVMEWSTPSFLYVAVFYIICAENIRKLFVIENSTVLQLIGYAIIASVVFIAIPYYISF